MQSKTTQGTMAEWLGIGLQNRAQQFDSAWYLKEGAVMRMHVWRLTFFYCGLGLTFVMEWQRQMETYVKRTSFWARQLLFLQGK